MIYDFECTSTCKPGTSPKTIGGVEVCTDCQEELNVPGCSSCDFSTSECTGCFSPQVLDAEKNCVNPDVTGSADANCEMGESSYNDYFLKSLFNDEEDSIYFEVE